MSAPDSIDVRRYDRVVTALVDHADWSLRRVARHTGVPELTVRKIWDGTISRPAVVVVERLRQPRRCGACGILCAEWPCISCEMRRRNAAPGTVRKARFVNKRQSR